MNKLLWIAAFLFSSILQAQTHKGISFQGVIKLPNGDFPTRSGMTVKAQILSPNGCILREEQFTAINISDGYIHLAVGTGTPLGYDKGFSMKQVMDNSAVITGLTCLHTDGTVNSGVTSFNPAVTSGARKLRISLTIDSYPIVADFNMRSMAYAINAESLNGKTESSFINTSANITQSALEAWFASAVLGQLTGGTYNAPTATTAVTAQGLASSYTVPLSQGGTGATTAAGARTNLGLGPLAEMTPTGTASSTTYLRGDGRWETVTGGVSSVAAKTGDVTLVAADITDFSTAADARITTQKGANNGIATLDGSGKVPSSQLALTTSDIPGLSASHITAGTFADSMLAGLSIDKLLNGSNKYFNYKPSNTACSDNEVLKYDSTLLSGQGGWKCAPDASGVGVEADPTVQAFAKNAPSTGLKVMSNQVAVDFGTAAGKVVEGNDLRLTGAFASSTTLSGDLSGTLPSPVVEKIKSQSISAAGSLAGQVLRYAGGSTWTPNFISMTDLRSSITGSAALSGTGCSSGQTLTWSSATDTLQCTAISITKSQVSDFPTLATSATTDTTNATNITSGTLNAARLPSSVTDALWTASSGNISRTTGNVGIGTASPAGKLSIEGSGVVGLQIKTTGAAAVDTMNLINDMDATGYFWFAKGNPAGASPSSSNRLVGITNEGNVEIYGQQTNGSVDASGVLSLKTQAASDGGTRNEVSMEFYADRSDLNTMSGFVGYENGTSFDLSLMNNKSGKLLFGTAGNTNLSVDAAGNIGVGTTTPGYLSWGTGLTVKAASNLQGKIEIVDSKSDLNANEIGRVAFLKEGYSAVNRELVSITANTNGATAGNRGGDLYFYTRANGASSAVANMVVAGTGYVGVGTTAPFSKLQVNGTVRVTAGEYPWSAAQWVRAMALYQGSAIVWEKDTAGVARGIGSSSNGSLYIVRSDANDASQATIYDMIVDTSGRVGIGNAPSEKLHVFGGNLRVQGTVADCTLGNGFGGTSCSSDERLKTNITEIEDSLNKILSLRGVEYDWNEKSPYAGTHAMGVIAQDVEKVFPMAVSQANDEKYKRVDYAVLVAPLIQAFKELHQKVLEALSLSEENTREIASVKEGLDSKDLKIHELEKRLQSAEEENKAMKAWLCSQNPKPPFCS